MSWGPSLGLLEDQTNTSGITTLRNQYSDYNCAVPESFLCNYQCVFKNYESQKMCGFKYSSLHLVIFILSNIIFYEHITCSRCFSILA